MQESSDPWHERTGFTKKYIFPFYQCKNCFLVTGNRTRRTKKQKIENRKQGKPPLFKFDSVPSYLLHHDDITGKVHNLFSDTYKNNNHFYNRSTRNYKIKELL